ncbi:hypothetical protein A4G20_04185 [Pasteurellaceae bacterium RH1A]|nr:hypothetical protein A4G20_04185 [Pasteurellaceae bacterium RH1A]
MFENERERKAYEYIYSKFFIVSISLSLITLSLAAIIQCLDFFKEYKVIIENIGLWAGKYVIFNSILAGLDIFVIGPVIESFKNWNKKRKTNDKNL